MLDHLDLMLHQIDQKLTTVLEFATPEARALLARWLDNPAVRWANRRQTGPRRG